MTSTRKFNIKNTLLKIREFKIPHTKSLKALIKFNKLLKMIESIGKPLMNSDNFTISDQTEVESVFFLEVKTPSTQIQYKNTRTQLKV